MYSKTIILGNVGKEPEMRMTPNGTAVTSFSVAVNVGFGDNKVTAWYRVTAWAKQAEVCKQYIKKGMTVLVEGELQPDKETGGPRVWGEPARASFDLNAKEVKFIGGGKKKESGGDPPIEDAPF